VVLPKPLLLEHFDLKSAMLIELPTKSHGIFELVLFSQIDHFLKVGNVEHNPFEIVNQLLARSGQRQAHRWDSPSGRPRHASWARIHRLVFPARLGAHF
jgi:hypothetical protein